MTASTSKVDTGHWSATQTRCNSCGRHQSICSWGLPTSPCEALSAKWDQSPAAVTEAHDVSQASSMRAAQLSGSREDLSCSLCPLPCHWSHLQRTTLAVRRFHRPSFNQETSAVEADQVGIHIVYAAFLFCGWDLCKNLPCVEKMPQPPWSAHICQPSCEAEPSTPWFLADFFISGSHSIKYSDTSQPLYNRQTNQPTELLHAGC